MIVGFKCQHRNEVRFEECFSCALTQKQPCQFSYPILFGMMTGENEEVKGIRVTSLLNCPRKVILEKRHNIYVPPEQLYWSFRGRLAHAIVEYAQAKDAIVEQRYTREIEGMPITGKPDVIYPEQALMVDYKTTAMVPKLGPYEHHTLQLNIYRWLVQEHYRVNHLEIVYLDMKNAKRYPVTTMSLNQVEEFIVPRARALSSALNGGELPPRTEGEGLWQCWGYCVFSHHAECWGESGPPERNRRETKGESRKRAIRSHYAKKCKAVKGGNSAKQEVLLQ
jgi:CRISPR/Cas system-associated exonuclease Cas4 (RecB family)